MPRSSALCCAGYPEGKLLQSMAFNLPSPGFQALVPAYRFAALPKAVRVSEYF